MDKKVKVSFPGGKRVTAEVGGHTILTDQAVTNGGTGTAPDPITLFLASLAACAGYYALEFCLSRGIDTNGLAVELDPEWNKEKKIASKMAIKLNLPTNFPEKYREAIIRAVDLCTVKRHLTTPPTFNINVN